MNNSFSKSTYPAAGVLLFLRKGAAAAVCTATALALSACSGNKDGEGNWPKGFDSLSDNAKVEYVMENATPDSLARFIIDASLGKVKGARIDTLSVATMYAYEHLKNESDIQTFSAAYDEYSANLPLSDKMQVMKMAGELDPQGIGYQLGLTYVDIIRTNRKNAETVTSEIEAFRSACGEDTVMFQRFLTGFRTVLDVDHGKDLPEDIYRKFKDYQ